MDKLEKQILRNQVIILDILRDSLVTENNKDPMKDVLMDNAEKARVKTEELLGEDLSGLEVVNRKE